MQSCTVIASPVSMTLCFSLTLSLCSPSEPSCPLKSVLTQPFSSTHILVQIQSSYSLEVGPLRNDHFSKKEKRIDLGMTPSNLSI
jgi:hypothetical protein